MPGNKSKLNSEGKMKQSCYIHVRIQNSKVWSSSQKDNACNNNGYQIYKKWEQNPTKP